MADSSNTESAQVSGNQAANLLLAYNCTECPSLQHRTGVYVQCPNCNYKDESNLGTGYDYLFCGEFLDSYCRNCGVRLQATFRISTSWITHLFWPIEIKNDWRHKAYLKGIFAWDYEFQKELV
jgi:hypothetical protein